VSARRSSASRARHRAAWALLLAAALAGCRDDRSAQADEAAAARGFADRLGLTATPSGPAPTRPPVPSGELCAPPSGQTQAAAAFAPRRDLVAAVRANRKQRGIPPDSALPRPSASSEGQLAAQTRAEIDRALVTMAKR